MKSKKVPCTYMWGCVCLIFVCEVDKVWLIFLSIFERILCQNVLDCLISQVLFGSIWELDELWNKEGTQFFLQFYFSLVCIIHLGHLYHSWQVNALGSKVRTLRKHVERQDKLERNRHKDEAMRELKGTEGLRRHKIVSTLTLTT